MYQEIIMSKGTLTGINFQKSNINDGVQSNTIKVYFVLLNIALPFEQYGWFQVPSG